MTKIISLSQAKEITELMKEKGFELPESEYYWFDDNFKNTKEGHDYFLGRINQHGDITLNDYPAYDCYELWSIVFDYLVFTEDNEIFTGDTREQAEESTMILDKDNITQALADTLIYLLKNNLYKNGK